jgi:hypothetical protein
MDKKSKQPLLRKSHLPLIILGSVMTGYGLLAALVGSWLSKQAMQGVISAGVYRSRLAGFEQTASLVAGILFLVFFIWCAVASSRIVRAAFSFGAVASLALILAPWMEELLFKRLGLPTMSAGSVLAGAVTTLLFALPLTILFILLACGRRVPRGCRWLAFASIFVVLATAVYPIYVTLLAFLVRPGDPAVGRMIEVSSQVLRLRFILPGLSFLLLALISNRFAQKQAQTGAETLPALAE